MTKPHPRALRTTVIVDYQNVHLTGRDIFDSERRNPLHQSRFRPLWFAQRLIKQRNSALKPGYPLAQLSEVKVFRGMPSATYDRERHLYNLAEHHAWNQDPMVNVVSRPLRYVVRREMHSNPTLPSPAARVVNAREKGVDVLCALATMTAANDPHVDLVILASHDSDLEPVVDAVQESRNARIEGFQWWAGDQPCQQGYRLHSEQGLWVTRLNEQDFMAVRETRDLRRTMPAELEGAVHTIAAADPTDTGLASGLGAAAAGHLLPGNQATPTCPTSMPPAPETSASPSTEALTAL